MLRFSEIVGTRLARRVLLVLLAAASGVACEPIDQRQLGKTMANCAGADVCSAMLASNTAGAGGLGQRVEPPADAASGSSPNSLRGNAGSGGSGSMASDGGAGRDAAIIASAGGAVGMTGAAGAGIAPVGAAAGSGAMGELGTAGGSSSCAGELLGNGGFETGLAPWVAFTTGQDPLVYDASVSAEQGVTPYAGQRLGWLGGVARETNRLSQSVTLAADASRLTFAGVLRIQVDGQHDVIDFLRASLVASGQRIALFEYDNSDATNEWVAFSLPPLDVLAYAGQTLTLELQSDVGDGPGTNFFLDELSLRLECTP
jgi:hypothetical protein